MAMLSHRRIVRQRVDAQEVNWPRFSIQEANWQRVMYFPEGLHTAEGIARNSVTIQKPSFAKG